MGYRTVTASAFFDVKTIEIEGTTRLAKSDIEKIVGRHSEKAGVWNADLKQIREDVEKLPLVKSAVVSRRLPDSLRVIVTERAPRAVVRVNSGDYWADDDGVLLGAVQKTDERPPFNLTGWDESKTDKAMRDNRERVKIYLKMLDEWQSFELAKRVSTVDLTDLQEPRAFVQDAGEQKKIVLPKDNFGKKLKLGIEGIAGKNKEVLGIDVTGTQSVLIYRENQNS